MINDLVVLQPPVITKNWSYEESVKKTRQILYQWKTLTAELANELWTAREQLSQSPSAAAYIMHGTKVPRTWTTYCQEIGTSRQVVNRWLERWFETPKLPRTTPELPSGVFNVIYADPPWQYDNSGFEQSAQSHYSTMSNEELYQLIERLNPHIASPAVLFLWITNPFLWVGHQLIEHWSFEYKTDMVWIKDKGPSIGWFTVSRHEHLFIATRGEGMHPEKRPISWFRASVTKHSRKPELIYKLIEEMYPQHKYLELFARNKREGWTSWGDEIS